MTCSKQVQYNYRPDDLWLYPAATSKSPRMEMAQLPWQPLPESDCFHNEKVFFYIQKGPILFQFMYIFSNPPTTHHNQGPGSICLIVFSQALPGTVGPLKLSVLQAQLSLSSAGSSSACCLLNFPWTFQQSCYPARLSPAWISQKDSPFPEAGHLSS